MIIDIETDDIADGLPLSRGHCPIALAMRRRGFEDVRVGATGVSFRAKIGEGRILVPLNQKAKEFVRRFDGCDTEEERRGLKPFSFTMEDVVC